MPTQKEPLLTEEACSQIWMQPIVPHGSPKAPKVGLEMEIFAYHASSLLPFGTDPRATLNIQTFLTRLAEGIPGSKIKRDEHTNLIVAIERPASPSSSIGGNFSVEPGGQLEYSSAPFESLSLMVQDVHEGLSLLEQAAQGELVFLSHGTNPTATPTHPLLLPKYRYALMTRYFESAPADIRGIHMMRHSATVQANIDIFGCAQWQDGVNLMQVLVPLTRHLFANSRYFTGKPSTFISERQNIWEHMDPSRSGFPSGLSFGAEGPSVACVYAKWARQASMLFLDNDLPFEEQPLYKELTFERWLKEGYKGSYPTLSDWQTHLGTLFPHLRLRQFLEVRHIDAQPFAHTFAPIAFFTALIQSSETRALTWKLLQKYNIDPTEVVYPAHSASSVDFSFIHQPLLNLAIGILKDSHETQGVQALHAYREFLEKKAEYWQVHIPNAAQAFVQKNATSSPAAEFMTHLS